MKFFLVKVLVSALTIAGITELARRIPLWGALLATLPINSVLAFIWIWAERRDPAPLITMSWQIFWLVLPSMALFAVFPELLRRGWPFAPSLLAGMAATAALYGAGYWLIRQGQG